MGAEAYVDADNAAWLSRIAQEMRRQDAEMAQAMRALAALGSGALRVPQRALDTLERLAPLPPAPPARLRA